MTLLKRRGFSLGEVPAIERQESDLALWQQGYAVFLPGQCVDVLMDYQGAIVQTEELVRMVLDEKGCDGILARSPYVDRLEPKFQSLGSVFNGSERQEIETVTFDVMDGEEIVAEDLWMKASWLSFHEDDASLRFRFSFGIDFEEDVAADPYRQGLSAELTDVVFPESGVITKNADLKVKLQKVLGRDAVHFVERIIYFNAPNGGAYFHHDLERGHAGVVFAQVTGSSFWLALPTDVLVKEIIAFSQDNVWPQSLTQEMVAEMERLVKDDVKLTEALDSMENEAVMHLINETESFVQFLADKGYAYVVKPGDVLLLPQADQKSCCWHTVFCLGDEMGEALSFAIR